MNFLHETDCINICYKSIILYMCETFRKMLCRWFSFWSSELRNQLCNGQHDFHHGLNQLINNFRNLINYFIANHFLKKVLHFHTAIYLNMKINRCIIQPGDWPWWQYEPSWYHKSFQMVLSPFPNRRSQIETV